MTMPILIFLWIFLGLLVILVGVAVAQIIQGLRYGGGTSTAFIATMAFTVVLLLLIVTSGVLLSNTDWHGTWTIGGSDTTNTTLSQ